ncbi:hypothetical protein BC834DRAFT_972693 [Gloeopeniophorella convolvens]|nr:hypothetical protein BC834DRAFT_972693 [Gloeopeniophorella convolvens]
MPGRGTSTSKRTAALVWCTCSQCSRGRGGRLEQTKHTEWRHRQNDTRRAQAQTLANLQCRPNLDSTTPPPDLDPEHASASQESSHPPHDLELGPGWGDDDDDAQAELDLDDEMRPPSPAYSMDHELDAHSQNHPEQEDHLEPDDLDEAHENLEWEDGARPGDEDDENDENDPAPLMQNLFETRAAIFEEVPPDDDPLDNVLTDASVFEDHPVE